MPVPPVPLDLRPLPLDPAAVADAMAACQRAAGLVGALAEARGRAAAAARAEWRGPTRDAFDEVEANLDREAVELVVELARAVGHLAAAVAEVQSENRRRADRREAWIRATALPS